MKTASPLKTLLAAAVSVVALGVAGASAALIQHQAPEIVARVNLFLGEGAVNKLRIVQGPLRRAAETFSSAV